MSESARQIFGGFRLEEVVGHGAQGRVWRAVCVDAALGVVPKGASVALKIKDVPDNADEKWRDLVERVAALKKMSHPNVVRYLGCFRINDSGVDKHVIVQELLTGETLKMRLSRLRLGLDVDEALRVVKAAVSGLEYTASLGIYHRDIKPGNIFLCTSGAVKLIDFGVAKQGDGTITESGNVRGTFDYLAPDFIAPDFRGDECSDVFSMGVVFHEVVTSALPYLDDGKGELGYVSRWTRHAGNRDATVFIKPLARRMLFGSEEVLSKALAPRREDRYRGFSEFAKGLAAIRFNELRSEGRTYRWLKFIGKGGFGEVFKARWMETGEPVAVKRLLNSTYAKRFYTEAKVMQQLKDPCFVSFVDFFVHGENAFLVMRFLDGMPGGSLRDAIDRSRKSAVQAGDALGGGLPKPLVLSAFERYARGLSLLHRRKPSIIHRDIKPSNLYYPEGRPDLVAIMDFGIVREEDSSFTSGLPPCTFDYAPPEIATTTDRGGPGMDIFALGLCLYEALTGKSAYPRITAGLPGLKMFIERCTSSRAPKFNDPRVEGDPELLDLLKRMTEPDVSKRMTDAEEVAVALRKLFFRQGDDDCSPTMVFDNAVDEQATRPIDEKQLMEWYRAWVEKHPGQSPFVALDESPTEPARKLPIWTMFALILAAAIGGAFSWPYLSNMIGRDDRLAPITPYVVSTQPSAQALINERDSEFEKTRRAEEAKRKAATEAKRRKQEEEMKRQVEDIKRKEAELAKLKAEKEELRKKAEKLAHEQAEREAAERRKAEEYRKAEEAKRRAEAEAKRLAQEEELRRQAEAIKRREDELAKLKAEKEELRKKAEKLAQERAEREAEERKKAAEALRKAEETMRRKQAQAAKPSVEGKASKMPVEITETAQRFYDEAVFRYDNQDYGGAFDNYYEAFVNGYPFSHSDIRSIKDSYGERNSTLLSLINRINAAMEIGRTPPRDLKETEGERDRLLKRYREMQRRLNIR